MQFAKLPTTRYSDARARVIRAAGIQGPQAYDYLFSSSQANYLGLYPLNTALAGIETCMSEAEFIGYVEKFEAAGFVKFDRENWLIWVIEGAERNIGELKQAEGKKADNKVVMVNKAFKHVPDGSPLKAEFYARYSSMLKLEGYSAPVAPARAPVAPTAPATPVAAPVAAPARPVAPPPAPAPVATPAPAPQRAVHPAVDADVRPGEFDMTGSHYKAALEALLDLRAALRSEYPKAGDALTRERAEKLRNDLGATVASDHVVWAVQNDDLNLDYVMSRAYPEPAEADI